MKEVYPFDKKREDAISRRKLIAIKNEKVVWYNRSRSMLKALNNEQLKGLASICYSRN